MALSLALGSRIPATRDQGRKSGLTSKEQTSPSRPAERPLRCLYVETSARHTKELLFSYRRRLDASHSPNWAGAQKAHSLAHVQMLSCKLIEPVRAPWESELFSYRNPTTGSMPKPPVGLGRPALYQPAANLHHGESTPMLHSVARNNSLLSLPPATSSDPSLLASLSPSSPLLPFFHTPNRLFTHSLLIFQQSFLFNEVHFASS